MPPVLSIIICTKNRPQDLSVTLDSICLQSFKPDYLIVVDDSSDDETKKIIDDYHDIIYFHPQVKHSGLPAARNAGLKYVPENTEVVLFLDDDVTLDKNYLMEIIKIFENSPRVYGTTGNSQTCYQKSPTMKKIILSCIGFILPQLVPVSLYRSSVTRSGVATMPLFIEKDTSVEWLSGCNMAYRHSIFKWGSKFDEMLIGYALGEDMLFSHKLYLSGKYLCRVNTAIIEHRCSEENRSDDLKMFVMTLAYRRYIIDNITNNKILSKLYYMWFSNMLSLSTFILCAVGKRDHKQRIDCSVAKEFVSLRPDISEINKFIKG